MTAIHKLSLCWVITTKLPILFLINFKFHNSINSLLPSPPKVFSGFFFALQLLLQNVSLFARFTRSREEEPSCCLHTVLAVLSAKSQGIARKLRHPRHSRAAEPDASVARPGPGPSPNLRPRGPVSIWDLASWGHLWHPSCRQQPFHATPPFPPAPLNP